MVCLQSQGVTIEKQLVRVNHIGANRMPQRNNAESAAATDAATAGALEDYGGWWVGVS